MPKRRTIELQCPKCGATMEWHEDENLKVCGHCGYAAKEIDHDLLAAFKLREKRKMTERQQQIEAEEKRQKENDKIFMWLGIFLVVIVAFCFAMSWFEGSK